ncbi:hypothetical protein PY65_13685 [Lacticaseibacillus rhamnosus]|nr:hypothetical protein PY65_13685 [Lacticaseibacillus rhamnosus]
MSWQDEPSNWNKQLTAMERSNEELSNSNRALLAELKQLKDALTASKPTEAVLNEYKQTLQAQFDKALSDLQTEYEARLSAQKERLAALQTEYDKLAARLAAF